MRFHQVLLHYIDTGADDSVALLYCWSALRELGREPDAASADNVLGVVFEQGGLLGTDMFAMFKGVCCSRSRSDTLLCGSPCPVIGMLIMMRMRMRMIVMMLRLCLEWIVLRSTCLRRHLRRTSSGC
jgi:hypothetical protein